MRDQGASLSPTEFSSRTETMSGTPENGWRGLSSPRPPRADCVSFMPIPTRPWNWAGLGGRRMVIFVSDWIRCPAWTTQWPSETPSPD